MTAALEKEKKEMADAVAERKNKKEEEKKRKAEDKKAGSKGKATRKKAKVKHVSKVPGMPEWGNGKHEEWNGQCDAEHCDADANSEVMCCFSCNVVMHSACAEKQSQDNFVKDGWLCVDCFSQYSGLLAD